MEEYTIKIRQEPLRGRMCGFTNLPDRRMLYALTIFLCDTILIFFPPIPRFSLVTRLLLFSYPSSLPIHSNPKSLKNLLMGKRSGQRCYHRKSLSDLRNPSVIATASLAALPIASSATLLLVNQKPLSPATT